MTLNYSYLCTVDEKNTRLHSRQGKIFPILAKKIFLGRAQKQVLKIGKRETLTLFITNIKNIDIMPLKVKIAKKNLIQKVIKCPLPRCNNLVRHQCRFVCILFAYSKLFTIFALNPR